MVGGEPVHRRSHQVADRIRLAVGQRAVAQLEHHRGLGGTFLLAKQRVMRQHQLHPRRVDIGQRAHGVFELPFESPLIVDLLVELRAHPVRLVEDLKPHPPALQTPLGRGRQPRLVQLVGRNQDAGPIRGGLVGDLRLAQDQRRLARVLLIKVRVERPPVGAQPIPEQPADQPQQQRRGGQRPAPLPRLHGRPAYPRPGRQSGDPVRPLRMPRNSQGALFQLCAGGHCLRSLGSVNSGSWSVISPLPHSQ